MVKELTISVRDCVLGQIKWEPSGTLQDAHTYHYLSATF
jgi:hypothetical protein